MQSKSIVVSVSFVVFLVVFQGCKTTKGNSIMLNEESAGQNAPRVTEFVLGPGDVVEITVLRQDDLRRTVQVSPAGKIMYPLAGDIQAGGRSIFQIRDEIQAGLANVILNPQVSVSIVSVQSQKIIVLGEVVNPGFFSGTFPMSSLEVIARAGGATANGRLDNVLLIRGGLQQPELVNLNLSRALNAGESQQNAMLRGGDILYVPRTRIANVTSFFSHLAGIIAPIVSMETGVFLGQQIDGAGGTTAVGN